MSGRVFVAGASQRRPMGGPDRRRALGGQLLAAKHQPHRLSGQCFSHCDDLECGDLGQLGVWPADPKTSVRVRPFGRSNVGNLPRGTLLADAVGDSIPAATGGETSPHAFRHSLGVIGFRPDSSAVGTTFRAALAGFHQPHKRLPTPSAGSTPAGLCWRLCGSTSK